MKCLYRKPTCYVLKLFLNDVEIEKYSKCSLDCWTVNNVGNNVLHYTSCCNRTFGTDWYWYQMSCSRQHYHRITRIQYQEPGFTIQTERRTEKRSDFSVEYTEACWTSLILNGKGYKSKKILYCWLFYQPNQRAIERWFGHVSLDDGDCCNININKNLFYIFYIYKYTCDFAL